MTGKDMYIGIGRIAILCVAICGSTVIAQTTTAPASAPATVTTPKAVASDGLENIDLLTLDIPTVVTAGRREQKITSVPYAVSVITAEDIRWSGARTVPDALRLAAGVDVADLSWDKAAVSVRGQHELLTRELLVLVDGRQIFDSLFGGTIWGAWPFQLEDIARIEVIRGPAGVTWGPNAMNGVINIITKDPADQKGLTVTGGGGNRGWNKEHIGYAFADKKLRMRVSGEYEGSDGFLKGGSILRSLDDDLKTGRATVHGIYDITPNDALTISGGSAITDGGMPETPLASFLRNKNPHFEANYLMGNWDHKITEDNRFSIKGFINDARVEPAADAVDYRYQQFALQFNHTFKPADNHTFTYGMDARTDLLNASAADYQLLKEDYVSTAIFGLYVQDEWRFAPKWALNIGARIDYEFYGGFQPSARAALSYELTKDSLLYGSVSRAVQMPPLGLRFLETSLADGFVYVTADQDLKSEQLIAYELGYRGHFFDALQTDVNVFCHNYEDMDMLPIMLGPPGLMRENVQNGYSACMYGVELDAKYALSKNLTLLGNYTFEVLDIFGNYSLKGTERMSPPRHKFMLGTRYSPRNDLHLSAHVYYVDNTEGVNPTLPILRQDFDSYFRLDLRAEYEFWKDHGSVAVGVRNLLDPHHAEGTSQFQNYAEVCRMVYAELRMTFK